MSSILRKAGEMGLNASAGHTMKFLGCIWNEKKIGKEEDNLEALSKKVNLMSEILARLLFEEQHTGTISRGVHDRSAGLLALVPQPRRWTRRTVSQLASTRRQLDQEARKDDS